MQPDFRNNVTQIRVNRDEFAELKEALGRLEQRGGPPHDGSMEARVAKLEAVAEHLRRDVDDLRTDMKELRRDVHGIRTTDFRLIFGAIIFVALGLAGLMAKGFHWL